MVSMDVLIDMCTAVEMIAGKDSSRNKLDAWRLVAYIFNLRCE